MPFVTGPNGTNYNTVIQAHGSGVVGFNYSDGTRGVTFGNGASSNTASISAAGKGTFTNLVDTGIEASSGHVCVQSDTGGNFSSTGAPCAVGTITGVTAGTGLTGGGTSGGVTVALATPVSTANGGFGADVSTASKQQSACLAGIIPLPCVAGTVSLTGQTGAISSTTIFTPSTAGFYTVSVNLFLQVQGTAGTIQPIIYYNNAVGGGPFTTGCGTSPLSTTAVIGAQTQSLCSVPEGTAAVQYYVTFSSVTGTPQYGLYITFTRTQ